MVFMRDHFATPSDRSPVCQSSQNFLRRKFFPSIKTLEIRLSLSVLCGTGLPSTPKSPRLNLITRRIILVLNLSITLFMRCWLVKLVPISSGDRVVAFVVFSVPPVIALSMHDPRPFRTKISFPGLSATFVEFPVNAGITVRVQGGLSLESKVNRTHLQTTKIVGSPFR